MKAGISLARAVGVPHYIGAGGGPACGVCTSQMFVKACKVKLVSSKGLYMYCNCR